MLKMIQNVWQLLREACGENDYARYRARALAEGREPESAREFYRRRQEEKYARPNRCC